MLFKKANIHKSSSVPLVKGVLMNKGYLKNRVYIRGKQVSWKKSYEYLKTSWEFSWGFGGAGPSQLAFALLLELTNEKIAYALHGAFEKEFIKRLPMDQNFAVPLDEVYKIIDHCTAEARFFPYFTHEEKMGKKQSP